MKLDHINAATLLESLHAGVIVHSPDTSILYANPKALELLRLTQEQILGKDAFDPEWRFLDEYKRALPYDEYPVNKVIALKGAIQNQTVGVIDSQDDQITWVSVNAYPELDSQGEIEQIVVNFMDISHEKKDIPYEDIVAFASDAIIVTEATPLTIDGPRIVYVNHAFTDIAGYTPDEVLGKTPRILQGEQTDQATKDRISEALKKGEPCREEILNYSKGGQPYWLDLNIVPLHNALGELTYFAAIERDISQQKQQELVLKDLAESDPLTHLKNRRGFAELAQTVMSNAQREQKPVTLALVDIDHFKTVNDTHGHDIGDEALIFLSLLMKASFRTGDVIARFGGEEFAILLSTDKVSAEKVLEQFRLLIETSPVPIKGYEDIHFTISIGYSEKTSDRDNLNRMIKRADKALYQAKNTGRNRICSL